MDRARPLKDPTELQPIELSVSVMSLVDDDADDGLAMALRRQGVKLAWATVGTIAV
jgi:hypothetical protein